MKKRRSEKIHLAYFFSSFSKRLLFSGIILLSTLCSACSSTSGLKDGGNSFLPKINLPEGPILNQGEQQPTPTPAPPVSFNIASKLDSQNILLEDVNIVSADGLASLKIHKGTRLNFPDGDVQPGIVIACRQPNELLKEKRLLWGQIYTISPTNLELDPPAILRIRYDPPFLDADKDEKDAIIGLYNPSKSKWEWLDGDLDLHQFAVTVPIQIFGDFSISLGLLYEAPMSFIPSGVFQQYPSSHILKEVSCHIHKKLHPF